MHATGHCGRIPCLFIRLAETPTRFDGDSDFRGSLNSSARLRLNIENGREQEDKSRQQNFYRSHFNVLPLSSRMVCNLSSSATREHAMRGNVAPFVLSRHNFPSLAERGKNRKQKAQGRRQSKQKLCVLSAFCFLPSLLSIRNPQSAFVKRLCLLSRKIWCYT